MSASFITPAKTLILTSLHDAVSHTERAVDAFGTLVTGQKSSTVRRGGLAYERVAYRSPDDSLGG